MADRMVKRMMAENIIGPADIQISAPSSANPTLARRKPDLGPKTRDLFDKAKDSEKRLDQNEISEEDSEPVNPDPVIESYDQFPEDPDHRSS